MHTFSLQSEDELPEPGKNIQIQQNNESVKVSDQRAGHNETQSHKTQNQSLSRTVSKQKENQSNTKSSIRTENQSSTGQENSQKRQHHNQSTERRQPDTALKDVATNSQNRDSIEKESQIEQGAKKKATSNVEKKSPYKREQGAHDKPNEGKRQKLEGSTVTAAEIEGNNWHKGGLKTCLLLYLITISTAVIIIKFEHYVK